MTEPAVATKYTTSAQDRAAPERPQRRTTPYVLDPAVLTDHVDALYRAAWALCGSPVDAEDLVQTTFLQVLKRPRIIRSGNERGYLLRALRNVYASHYRALARRPVNVPLLEEATASAAAPTTSISSRELMQAVASAPARYRDAVIAVDILGMSYREAARASRTREQTIATRLHRGRQHVAQELTERGV